MKHKIIVVICLLLSAVLIALSFQAYANHRAQQADQAQRQASAQDAAVKSAQADRNKAINAAVLKQCQKDLALWLKLPSADRQKYTGPVCAQ